MTWIDWYDNLAKPGWTPSPSTIGLIWTLLYPVILVSFGFVFLKAFLGKVPRIVAVPFAINLIANLLFMPIFSGMRNVPLAAVDIVIVWTPSSGAWSLSGLSTNGLRSLKGRIPCGCRLRRCCN